MNDHKPRYDWSRRPWATMSPEEYCELLLSYPSDEAAATDYEEHRAQRRKILAETLEERFEDHVAAAKQRILAKRHDPDKEARDEVLRANRKQLSGYDKVTRLTSHDVYVMREALAQQRYKDMRREMWAWSQSRKLEALREQTEPVEKVRDPERER